jgi:hypothetical protein
MQMAWSQLYIHHLGYDASHEEMIAKLERNIKGLVNSDYPRNHKHYLDTLIRDCATYYEYKNKLKGQKNGSENHSAGTELPGNLEHPNKRIQNVSIPI